MRNFDEKKVRNLEVCETAEEFVKSYYKNFDSKRHLIGNMYAEGATYVWNGNGVASAEQIQLFANKMPESSHSVISLDAQSINAATNLPNSVMIHVSGQVTFEGAAEKRFFQTFVLVQMDQSWKVISDCVRTIDPPDSIRSQFSSMLLD